MSLPDFAFAAPRSLDEATALLARPGARVLAGGTDLLPRLERRQLTAEVLVSLARVADLGAVAFDAAAGLSIGAAARLVEVGGHAAVRELYPALTFAISQMATSQIRNMATIAGNVCNGSPCADSVPVLIAAGARAVLVAAGGRRTVELDAFFRGPGVTVLEPGELVSHILVPPPPPATGLAFEKLPARTRVDVSAVNVGARVAADGGRCREARIVLGAVGPTPIRARRAEALLAGRVLDAALLAEAGALAAEESRPISDVRASAAYRRAMVAVLTRRALATAAARAGLAPVAQGAAS